MGLTVVFGPGSENIASWPSVTVAVSVIVYLALTIVRRDAGQLAKPVNRHCVAVYVVVNFEVVTSTSARIASVGDASAVAGTVRLFAQRLARVVVNTGVAISSSGPILISPNSIMAPALAPRFMA